MDKLLQMLQDRPKAIFSEVCVSCKLPASDFRDEASKREYQISALCQSCQDEAFNCEV